MTAGDARTDALAPLRRLLAPILVDEADLPPAPDRPWYVAPLPRSVEDLGLALAWPVALVNLLGTLFGFWYYGVRPIPLSTPLIGDQLARTPTVMWPFVPDSPLATLFIGASLVAWRRGWDVEWLHALAFFGCLKLGLWTPFVQLVVNGQGSVATWMYQFLVWSHLAMAVQAFLIHRYSRFPVWAIGVAAGWYLLNDVVDYFVPVVGPPHHTDLRGEVVVRGGELVIDHGGAAHDLAAAAAVTLTVLATFLALSTRVAMASDDVPTTES